MKVDIIENELSSEVYVALEGRIDTINAADFESKIIPVAQRLNPDIVIDCKELAYISSSGLRVFLTLQKKVIANQGKLVLKCLRPEIMGIFEMTGFSSIFQIQAN